VKEMKKIVFLLILLMYSLTSVHAKNEITNVGFTFNPSTLTIVPGENVTFTLEATHNAVEVSKATWDANGTTPLAGGFSVPFGGGEVLPAQLPNGTHWYVCTTHAAIGMKGIIIVGTPTGIEDNPALKDISIFPNPATDFITVRAGSNLLGIQYSITDQHGKQMVGGKIDSDAITVNISKFSEGIYFFILEGQNKRSFKVIKN
jgi:plastocyanin